MAEERKFERVLITGITGFVGSHLAEFILDKFPEVEVAGFLRWRSPLDNIFHILNKIKLFYGDLTDLPSLKQALGTFKPDAVFHLAAQSYVDFSFVSPIATLQSNVIGTCNLLEAVRDLKNTSGYDPFIHICSSSEVYGQVKEDEVPITEANPFRPASPYAVSKVGEDMVSLQYWLSWKIKTIRTRMFTHSVSKWTPVILRDIRSGLIDIKYISEIRSLQKKGGYLSGSRLDDGTQVWDMARSGLEIWNDNKWTKIKHISCHPLNGHKVIEVACRGGVVDVTDNHSIINNKGCEVEAGKLKVGDLLKLTGMPSVSKTHVQEELAWLYGFFVAEGCVTGGRMRIDNQDINKLERAKDILIKYLAIHCDIRKEKDVYRLIVRKPFNIERRFYEECYAKDKNKRIPILILNADKKTKLAFLRGYNEGDGEVSDTVKSEFYRFKTKSPVLAAGLCYLIETALGVKYRIHTEHRDSRRYFEIRCLTQEETNNGNHLLKSDCEITKLYELEYSDEVWDFETENHWFHAGIGGNIVHNTGPRRGEVFALSNFAKQVAAIENGLLPPVVKVGNLNSIRTFSDVRDAVKAYWLLLKLCPAGDVFNIGGVETMTIGEMLDRLLQVSTRSDIKIEVDPARLRPSDVTLQIPCIEKFQKITGWKPEIKFEKTIQDTLDYWRDFYNKQKKIIGGK